MIQRALCTSVVISSHTSAPAVSLALLRTRQRDNRDCVGKSPQYLVDLRLDWRSIPIARLPALTVTSSSVDFRALMHPTFHDSLLLLAQLRGCAFARGNGIQDSVRARPVGYPILDRREGTTA